MELQLQIIMNEKLFLRNPQLTDLGRKILLHSIQLIHKNGFESFTFKKLAEDIGTTEAGIYRYFENKHRLLIYITAWYWSWLEYRVTIFTQNMFKEIKSDLPASIVVFFVAVPLCLGIALASGAPLFAGIIAGIVGGIVVGVASGSPLGVSGPAAGLAVIVLTSIAALGSWPAFLLAVVLAGFIQLIMGFAKAGFIAYFFPSSVIKGMLTGIGLLIILKQIPHALGYDKDAVGDDAFFQTDGGNTLSSILSAVDVLTPGAILISTVSARECITKVSL